MSEKTYQITERKLRKILTRYAKDILSENFKYDGVIAEGATSEWMKEREILDDLKEAPQGIKWVNAEVEPLIIKEGRNWQTTKAGSGMFLAALQYHDKTDGKTHWWIRQCVIEDEVGLCEVGEIENVPCGWEADQVEYYMPIKAPDESASEEAPDLKELRERFYDECTEEVSIWDGHNGTEPYMKRINMTPHNLFEWFKPYLQLPKEDTSIHQIK
jgi:hypothetical protein